MNQLAAARHTVHRPFFVAKLTVNLIVAMTLVTIVGFFLLATISRQVERADLKQRGTILLSNVCNACTMPLWQIDVKAVSFIANAYLQAEDVNAIRIRNEDGVVLFDERRGPNAKLSVNASVTYKKRAIGDVTIELRDKTSGFPSGRLALQGGLLLFVVMLVAAGVTTTSLRRYLRRFFDTFSKAALMVENGQAPDGAVPFREMEPYLQQLERMHCRIDEQIKQLVGAREELATLNHSLELKVKERTSALAAANVDLEEARNNAEAASKAKSVFLTGMSHEFRTPLNAIIGFSHLLIRRTDLPNDVREDLEIVSNSGEHLLSLINDVLDLAKIEAGKMELVPENCNPRNEIQSVIDMMRVRAQQRGIAMHSVEENALPEAILIDRKKMRQVLLNLLGNAVKFTNAGNVSLSVTFVEPDRLSFAITDTGSGMTQEELAGLFSMFSQTRQGQLKSEGTGLGLFISKEIIELMGGELGMSSEPGIGTTATFSLRFERTRSSIVSHSSDAGSVVRLTPDSPHPHMLVVDDNAVNRQYLARLLRSVGFEVTEAVNGQIAVEAFQVRAPDLIFMDIQMPIMDGLEATNAIRRLPNGDATPIIAYTASAFDKQREAFIALGCNAFLGKPARESEVFSLIESLLPVTFTREPNPLRSPLPLPTPRPSDVRVLVVDDTPINVQLLGKILDGEGISFDDAGSGAEALRRCEEKAYDLIFLDLHMPDLSGWDVIAELRKRPTRLPAIVLLTGSESTNEDPKELCNLVSDRLLKPFHVQDIQNALRKHGIKPL